jgi:hypothetical protein
MLAQEVRSLNGWRVNMSITKTALVAAALVAFAAAANAQSREGLNSGYHGNTPVYSSPYGPTDEIQQDGRDAFAQDGVRAPQTGAGPRFQSRNPGVSRRGERN